MKRQTIFYPALKSIAFILCMYFISSCASTKQPTGVPGASAAETEQAITTDRWIFVANQAMPQRGRSRMLTSHYSVLCNRDSLTSDLPYFGRAYSAPIGETTSPLSFTSTDFSLSKNGADKGKWTINIKPKDKRDIQSYMFTLFTNGSAQLSIQLTNRSAISFSGTVMPVK